MATMEGFDHILNWKLKAGSTRFPEKTAELVSTRRLSSPLALSTGPFAGSRTCRSASRARSAVSRCN